MRSSQFLWVLEPGVFSVVSVGRVSCSLCEITCMHDSRQLSHLYGFISSPPSQSGHLPGLPGGVGVITSFHKGCEMQKPLLCLIPPGCLTFLGERCPFWVEIFWACFFQVQPLVKPELLFLYLGRLSETGCLCLFDPGSMGWGGEVVTPGLSLSGNTKATVTFSSQVLHGEGEPLREVALLN